MNTSLLKEKKITINSCKQANGFPISEIADYDYFRFKLLTVSCTALNKYSTATSAHTRFFPDKLDNAFIYTLPATVAPLLSKADFLKRKDTSVKIYNKNTEVTIEKENTFKLLTKEDEIYLTLLARGDFDKDGFEDLLIQSEWYAREAHGKHVDLLLLTKTNLKTAVNISWRLNNIN